MIGYYIGYYTNIYNCISKFPQITKQINFAMQLLDNVSWCKLFCIILVQRRKSFPEAK